MKTKLKTVDIENDTAWYKFWVQEKFNKKFVLPEFNNYKETNVRDCTDKLQYCEKVNTIIYKPNNPRSVNLFFSLSVVIEMLYQCYEGLIILQS